MYVLFSCSYVVCKFTYAFGSCALDSVVDSCSLCSIDVLQLTVAQVRKFKRSKLQLHRLGGSGSELANRWGFQQNDFEFSLFLHAPL